MHTISFSKEEMAARIEAFFQRTRKGACHSNPTLASVMALRIKDCDPEKKQVEFGHPMCKESLNDVHAMHGGLAATLLDHAMAATAAAYSDGQTIYVTQDLYIQYLSPIQLVPELTVRVQLLHVGKRSISMSAHLLSGETLCCTMTGTFSGISRPTPPSDGN